MEVENSMCRW